MTGRPPSRVSRPRVAWRDVNGILLLDKSPGMSSNAALQTARRLFRAHKAGHTGSLDPLASGLLPLCFGQATKISGMLLDADKTYRVTAMLGLRTTTGDAEGEVVEIRPVPRTGPVGIDEVLKRFTGPIEQVPPMYSALKHDGQRLYALARKGIVVPRAPRSVRIHELRRTGWDGTLLSLEARCSKGTYVRTLVEDIAQSLGTVGHVVALRRTQLGPFRDEQIWRLEELEALAAGGGEAALDGVLHALDFALAHWPAVQLGGPEQAYVLQGQAVFASGPAGEQVRMYGPGGLFLGVGQMTTEGRRVAPVRIMLDLASAEEPSKPLEAGLQRG
jgi:tRNA pseudouridine55 synthase